MPHRKTIAAAALLEPRKKIAARRGHFCDRTSVPISCGDCARGKTTIYRAALKKNADQVTATRQGILKYAANRIILRQKQVPDIIFTVHEGWLCRYRQLADGRQQIVSFIVPGDTITFSTIFMPGQPLSYSIKTITDVQLCSFDRDKLREMLQQDPAYMEPFYSDLAGYLDSVTSRIADIGQRSARGRMGKLFVELYRRHERHGLIVDKGFRFPISQEMMASAMGITKAYVNRTIAGMRAEGLIELDNDWLRLPDVMLLQECAEDA